MPVDVVVARLDTVVDAIGAQQGTPTFESVLLALDAASGEYRWHYQVVRHDLWDRDLPSPPNLVQVTRDGETVDAVAQVVREKDRRRKERIR